MMALLSINRDKFESVWPSRLRGATLPWQAHDRQAKSAYSIPVDSTTNEVHISNVITEPQSLAENELEPRFPHKHSHFDLLRTR